MTQAKGQRSTHTRIHKWSLLFSFLIAWELAEGPQTSHQEGGERWEGGKQSTEHFMNVCVSLNLLMLLLELKWATTPLSSWRGQITVCVCVCVWVEGASERKRERESSGSKEAFFFFTPQAYCTFDLKTQKNNQHPPIYPAKQSFPFAAIVCVCVFMSSCQHAVSTGWAAGWEKNKQESYLCLWTPRPEQEDELLCSK